MKPGPHLARAHTRKRKASPEQAIQREFFRLLRTLGGPRVFGFSIPNEGKRSAQGGAAMVKAGLVAGIPDVFVCWWDEARGRPCTHFIEFKAPKGRLTDKQRDAHAALQSQGQVVTVAWSAEEALTQLRAQGCPLAELRERR